LLLREVASETLIVALKGASPPLLDKVFRNMSSRAADALRDDLDMRGAVRLKDIETQQKEILKTLRRMSDEGVIVMGEG